MPSYREHVSSHNMSSSNKLILGGPTYRSTNCTPNEVITLNFEDSPVFIKRPETYQEAIKITKKEYPQLAHLPDGRIGLALNDIVHGNGRHVKVSESAWSAIAEKIPGGTIFNIMVLPDPDAKPILPPPEYLDVPTSSKHGSWKDNLSPDWNSKKSSASSSSLSLHHSKSATSLFSWIGPGK